MKEITGKLRFLIDRTKYSKGKNLYISIIVLLIVIVASFIVIYINMKIEVKRKENILKSYYQEEGVAGYESNGVTENGATGTNKESNEAGALLINNDDSNNNKNSSDSLTTDSDGINNVGGTVNIIDKNSETDKIKVYICGSVKNPGVYEINAGARVIDLLEAAGGGSEDACLEIINLAQPVSDGQRIYVPSEEEIKQGSSLFLNEESSSDYQYSGNKIININQANLQELQELPGIGPALAQNIIEYRSKNGAFKRKEELKNVTGIGDKKYEKISELISI
jgi:competence protein ComEA